MRGVESSSPTRITWAQLSQPVFCALEQGTLLVLHLGRHIKPSVACTFIHGTQCSRERMHHRLFEKKIPWIQGFNQFLESSGSSQSVDCNVNVLSLNDGRLATFTNSPQVYKLAPLQSRHINANLPQIHTRPTFSCNVLWVSSLNEGSVL